MKPICNEKVAKSKVCGSRKQCTVHWCALFTTHFAGLKCTVEKSNITAKKKRKKKEIRRHKTEEKMQIQTYICTFPLG